MAYFIRDFCENCAECEIKCPTECIYKGETHREIDASKCIECGTCKRACPVGAPTKITQ